MSDPPSLPRISLRWVIPKRVRNSYRFEKGDVIVFEREGDGLYLKAGNES